jgi:hypothetical protein
VGLTINELNLIANSPAVELSHLESAGRASDKAYIGEDKAAEAALSEAGLERSLVSGLKCEMDFDNGVMVYEVEFISGGVEYEYEIDAVTGEVVKSETEPGSDDDQYDTDDDGDDADDDGDSDDDYDDVYDNDTDDDDADDQEDAYYDDYDDSDDDYDDSDDDDAEEDDAEDDDD